ncbi:MAG TPA: hypothetical protein VH593_30475 [Ktedonobacteraceae bacterium]
MTQLFKPQHKEQPGTSFVQDRSNKEEVTRLKLQDQLIPTAMGGTLPEQAARQARSGFASVATPTSINARMGTTAWMPGEVSCPTITNERLQPYGKRTGGMSDDTSF